MISYVHFFYQCFLFLRFLVCCLRVHMLPVELLVATAMGPEIKSTVTVSKYDLGSWVWVTLTCTTWKFLSASAEYLVSCAARISVQPLSQCSPHACFSVLTMDRHRMPYRGEMMMHEVNFSWGCSIFRCSNFLFSGWEVSRCLASDRTQQQIWCL